MTDLEKARELLHSGNYGTCVLYNSDIFHTSFSKGIKPVLEFLTAGLDLKGFSAADTVAGKALALLLAYAGVEAVYANVMSKGAFEILKRYNIRCVYEELTEQINNRTGDGLCPVELLVADINEPEKAFKILSEKF
jgi:hypothetical protein